MDLGIFLKRYGLAEEDLNASERETYYNMLHSLQQSELTIEKIREYIGSLRDAVENELTKYDLGPKQDIYLKARLRNYMLLESFLQGPVKAKKKLEETLKRVA